MKTVLCQARPLYPPLYTQRQSCENAAIASIQGLKLCGKHRGEATRAPGLVNVWRTS